MPFTTLAEILADVLNTNTTVAGIILGAVLTVVLVVVLEWAIGSEGKDTLLVSASVGIIISTLVGWFPLWVIVFIALIIVLIIVKPFGGATNA